MASKAKQVAKPKIKSLGQSIGKTLKAQHDEGRIIWLMWSDDSFSGIFAKEGWPQEVTTEHVPDDECLLTFGIIDQAEFDRREQERDSNYAAKVERRERAELERLQAKYPPGPGDARR